MGHAAVRQRHGAVRRRRDRRLPRLSARAAGAARPRLQPRDREHAHRSAMVTVLLLHDATATAPGCAITRPRPSASCARSSRPPRSAQAEPENAARRLVDGGFAKHYDYALETIRELPYEFWHEYDPADSLRFYALRLHEGGHDQVEPERAPRRGHRLALRQRAQARAEGVSHAGARWSSRLALLAWPGPAVGA